MVLIKCNKTEISLNIILRVQFAQIMLKALLNHLFYGTFLTCYKKKNENFKDIFFDTERIKAKGE
jgi:hypothetical protein